MKIDERKQAIYEQVLTQVYESGSKAEELKGRRKAFVFDWLALRGWNLCSAGMLKIV